jgi:hypothetical protein
MPTTENIEIQSYFSRIEPKSHFFIDTNALAQNNLQSFGPVSGNENTKFRVTAKFTCASQSKAYTICAGHVLIQPYLSDSSKVNVLLRPYKQPIQGLSVKFFVYRGLRKSDFFSTGETHIIPDNTGNTDFIKTIWQHFTAFHQGQNPMPEFLAKHIGYNPAVQPASTLIDDLLFKLSDATDINAFELPMIEEGKVLGYFMGEGGIDVVLNNGDYKSITENNLFPLDLGYLRHTEAILDTAIPAITSDFQKKVFKENIYNFLDIAAFFGLHYSDKGYVTTDNGGAKVIKKQQQIYTDLLSPFFTKNNLYLYVISDRGRSFNFYGNYNESDNVTDSIKTGITNTALASSPFGINGWPLMIINADQSHNRQQNSLHIRFTLGRKDDAIFYASTGQAENASKNNFILSDILNPANSGDPYSSTVQISFPAFEQGAAKKNIAYPVLLLYSGREYTLESGSGATITTVVSKPEDDIFDLADAVQLLPANGDVTLSVIAKHKKNLLTIPGVSRSEDNAVLFSTAVAYDKVNVSLNQTVQRIIYFTQAADVYNNTVSANNKISADTPTLSNKVFFKTNQRNEHFQLPGTCFFETGVISDGFVTFSTLQLRMINGTLPNFRLLGLTMAENDLLKSVIVSFSGRNTKLHLGDYQLNTHTYRSSEGITFSKYNLGISGEDTDGNLRIWLPAAPVIVYTLDKSVLFSKDFSNSVLAEETLYGGELLDKKIIL